MAAIRPFRALRPVPELAEQVACVPYDVVDDDEVLEYVRDNPLSFLRVTRPEAELPEDERSTPVLAFERARSSLRKLIDDGVLVNETEPSFYVYQLSVGDHRQTGVVACCSLDEYESGLIRKHENTRPDKVLNRTGHLLTLRAQTGLILLAYQGTDSINSLTNQATTDAPLYDFQAGDGSYHKIWRVTATNPWIDAFREVRVMYIADGHHRIESADVARRRIATGGGDLPAGDEFNYVMAGIFPAEELKILAYNRAVKGLGGLSHEDLLARIQESFVITGNHRKEPETHGEICMYLGGRWYTLMFSVAFLVDPGPIARLDVSILQDYVLGPVLGIDDPRTNERLMFVGGKRGTAELEKLVDRGKASVAFSLFPTTMYDLFEVSDAKEIMPPKSTWFEPKLKDGLLVHKI